MRVGRTIIIPVILALSAAGSILTAGAVPGVAAVAPAAHVHVVAGKEIPRTYHHW